MNKQQIIQEFSCPSVAYRGKPFWSWNGELRGEELVRQAHIMKEMGLGGYFMHSRAGLITEYLGDEWFEVINQVADAAEADGMEAWLYDEDRWPSGSAGGKVTVNPAYRMKSLYIYETDPDKVLWDEQSFALYVAKIQGINLYTYKELDTSAIVCAKCAARLAKEAIEELSAVDAFDVGEWKVLRFAIVPDAPSSGYNGTTYIDTMSRKATDKFIEMTHGAYLTHCGDRVGRSIKGIFTDEPHRGHCLDNISRRDGVMSCAMAWTDDIFEEFEKRYGFACRPILPELFYRKNGELVAPVKLHYIDLADALFLERFAMPINEWCKAHNMIFTGHVLHEDSLMNQTAPHGSLMRFYEHMGYPGVDVLTEHNRNYWIVKQLASVARQLGQKWMLSELYGAVGWPFDFKGQKATGDWQALFGINVRCQHLSWYTMEGEAKRDYPASMLHQSPWYKDYSKVENYFARFGLVMSEGRPCCDVLLLNPIESLWCQAYVGWASSINNASVDVEPYEVRYRQLFHFLTGNQIDFDYGEEEMMSRYAAVDVQDGVPVLRVGKATYQTVIVSNMLTIRPTTLKLLKDFVAMGGKVIFCGDVPAYVNAVASDEPAQLSKQGIIIPFDEAALVAAVRQNTHAFVSVTNQAGETEKSVFAQVRCDFGGDGYAAVVLNTDRQNPRKDLTLSIKAPQGYVPEMWDMDTSIRYDAATMTTYDDGIYHISLDLEAAGTCCFVLSKTVDETLLPMPAYETMAENTLMGEFHFAIDEPNVCVLDWCRWRWADGQWHDEKEVLWADREIRSAIGIEHRGGGMLQPWYAKKYDTKAYGDIQLSYEFFIDEMPKTPIYLAGERPEFNTYRVNGVGLQHEDVNDFWIDDCFKKMLIPMDALKIGRNEVTIDVTFKRTTNIEALYLVGDFGVKLDGRKRHLVVSPGVMGCDDYVAYDMPFFTGNLTFTLTADDYLPVLGDTWQEADRIVLIPQAFTGACVKVRAAGNCTILGWAPYEVDVTRACRDHLPIEVTVDGTRTNVFGPLHEVAKPAGLCSPGNFLTTGDQWTDDYSLLPSGLRGFTFKMQKKRN